MYPHNPTLRTTWSTFRILDVKILYVTTSEAGSQLFTYFCMTKTEVHRVDCIYTSRVRLNQPSHTRIFHDIKNSTFQKSAMHWNDFKSSEHKRKNWICMYICIICIACRHRVIWAACASMNRIPQLLGVKLNLKIIQRYTALFSYEELENRTDIVRGIV